MESLSFIILALFLIRIIRSFAFSEYEDDENNILSNYGFGEWFKAKLALIVADYFSGKHLIYKWVITIAGVVVIIIWIAKIIIDIVSSIWFWIILGIAGTTALIIFVISVNKKRSVLDAAVLNEEVLDELEEEEVDDDEVEEQ